MRTDSGHEIVLPDPDVHRRINEHWQGFKKLGIKRVMPGNFYGTDHLMKKINQLYHFDVRADDTYVCSYLRVGSNWLKEIVWAIRNNPNLDNPIQNIDGNLKVPWFEAGAMMTTEQIPFATAGKIPDGMSYFDKLELLPNPRTLHTHIPFSMLNPVVLGKTKIVYVIRDPRDVCLSFYHFASKILHFGYSKSLETFVNDFIDGAVFSGAYLDHLRQWWPVRNKSNVYTIYYESMKENPAEEIKKLAGFLEVNLTEQQILNVVKFTSFNEMKNRESTMHNEEARRGYIVDGEKSAVFRKGIIGSSTSEVNPDLNEKIAKHFRENLGEIKLPYNFGNDA